MDERQAKRDLVLAPSEYAYMQDVTKGVIKTYTGPTVINPTAQERPVVFNAASKRFEPCTLDNAVQTSAIAPEGYSLSHHEYRDGDYERAFTVSEAIDAENIQAELRDGVLRVTLPKSQPAPAKTIQVKASA